MSIDKRTITRRMDSVLNDLEEEFKSLCSKDDFENKLDALKKAWNKSDRSSKLRNLYDMFDVCKIKYERDKDYAYYENLVNSSEMPTFSAIEDKMMSALYSRYKKFPAPEEYMKRIVDKLCTDKDGWQNDKLRLRILKQFIKYGNYLRDAGYGGRNAIRKYVKEKIGRTPSDEDVLADLDDGVFSVLETAKKEQSKPDGTFGLLKISDDLAKGQFRAEGSTKKVLYHFAMVFGMTYYSGGLHGGEIQDFDSDIEKNLFRDYYINNFMRFILDAYKKDKSKYELDPSGQGINYKNFAEMIYIYYISRDFDPEDPVRDRRERIRSSNEMIARVKEKQFAQGHIDTKKAGGTKFYKGRFFRDEKIKNLFSEDILSYDEEQFEEFICENYDCDTYAGTYEIKNGSSKGELIELQAGELQLQTEQNSAFEVYQSIINELTKLGVALENCNYGLWFTDVAALKKNCENVCDRNPEIDRKEFQDFMDLLSEVNRFLGHTFDEDESTDNINQEKTDPSKIKTKALYVTKASEITRTSILVAYYYYYNSLHDDDGNDKWMNFEEVFNNFKAGIDPKLEAAYYQPLSGKNIFDVLVVFSSYAYLNI